MAKKLIVIDGNSLLFRAYFATAYAGVETIMRTKDGTPTNAIFAFANMINKILFSFKGGEYIFVGFDAKGKTFRKEEFEDYKANRKPVPEELIVQMPMAREFLTSIGIKHYEQSGLEGDDICGTVAKLASKEGYTVNVYTSDRDFLQLVDDNITVQLIKRGLSDILPMTPNLMQETYGFSPMQITDFKGLRGDSSDNLPGIPGIGEKTATKLIQEYGTFENIIANAQTIGGKVGESIEKYKEEGAKCKHLAIIKTDCELPFSVEDTLYKGYEFNDINTFCQKYELKSVLNRLPNKFKIADKENAMDIKVETVSDIPLLTDKEIGVAIELNEENYHNADILGIAISNKEHTYYVKVENIKTANNLKNVLENSEIKKCCYDYKAIKVVLSHLGIVINGLVFDLLLGSYMIDSSLKNDITSVLNYFGVDIGKKNEEMSLFESQYNPEYIGKVAYCSIALKERLFSDLKKSSSYDLYIDTELPLADVLADIEIEGFPLDSKTLKEIGENFKNKLNGLTIEIYALAGCKFNIASPKQVGEVLFNNLKLPQYHKESTSSDVLEEIINEHPIVNKILEYRKYAKLISTYVDSLVNHVHEDGKIHAMFNQALTTTGRLSSSEPNLQNISVRDEEGKLIRKAFYYNEEDYDILSLDYSQIELRILASIAKCQSLIDIFNEGHDIHSETAKKVFNLDREPTDLERRRAKAVNFGIVYGISEFGLQEQIGVSRKEAKEIICSFYDAYPEIANFMKDVVLYATENGYVKTYFGRIRYLREIHDQNYQVREFAKRAAMNAPIQGTAADIIKKAMIKVNECIKNKYPKSKMVLQIHDELLFKVHKDDKEAFYNDIKYIMEHVVDLPVQLLVDGGFGKTWYEAK